MQIPTQAMVTNEIGYDASFILKYFMCNNISCSSVLIRHGKNKSAELVLLDHGLYEKLPTEVRTNLSHLWKAIVLCNHRDMRKYSHELGVYGKYNTICII